jgi:dolichol-phosphate mannosyltransferase
MIELAVVIPTFNERDNIVPLLELLAEALNGITYEVIFVDDDSPDNSGDLVRGMAVSNPHIRIVERVHRRGLASACVEGMLASSAPYIAIMDADMQHDERILPEMLRIAKTEDVDVVIGSRNVEGGSMGEFSTRRVRLSMLGRRFSQAVCKCPVQDPMSGFFLLRRAFLMEVVHRVSGIGFKILVDLLASSTRPPSIREVPYKFRKRLRGESKLDVLVAAEYLQLLVDKAIGDFIPPSFVLFSLIGSVGVAIHIVLLWVQFHAFHEAFLTAQIAATVVTMTANFVLNNLITYRAQRVRGWGFVRGLLIFYMACSVGLLINLRVAEFIRDTGVGSYISGVFGLAVGSVWNYVMTRLFAWRTYRSSATRRARAHATAPSRVDG